MTRESYFDGQAVRYDIVDLRLFIHVAESNSLSRGAERSNLSASAASIRIKNLEQNLGVQLLKRTGRGVDLTGPGETFLRHARVVIRELENMHAELREHVKGVRGQVKVGANVSGLSGLLPQAMRRYLVSHADVEVDLREYSSEDAISALIEGDIDIALVSWVKQREGLEIFPLHAERSVLIVSPAHPLATNPSTTFAQALDYDFIGLGAIGE